MPSITIQFDLTDDRESFSEFYCCNLNHDTRHNLITRNRLQTNICFFCFTQSFCFTQYQNYILRGKHNEASDTFLKVLFPN